MHELFPDEAGLFLVERLQRVQVNLEVVCSLPPVRMLRQALLDFLNDLALDLLIVLRNADPSAQSLRESLDYGVLLLNKLVLIIGGGIIIWFGLDCLVYYYHILKLFFERDSAILVFVFVDSVI